MALFGFGGVALFCRGCGVCGGCFGFIVGAVTWITLWCALCLDFRYFGVFVVAVMGCGWWVGLAVVSGFHWPISGCWVG